jgi:hypothetical protein
MALRSFTILGCTQHETLRKNVNDFEAGGRSAMHNRCRHARKNAGGSRISVPYEYVVRLVSSQDEPRLNAAWRS